MAVRLVKRYGAEFQPRSALSNPKRRGYWRTGFAPGARRFRSRGTTRTIALAAVMAGLTVAAAYLTSRTLAGAFRELPAVRLAVAAATGIVLSAFTHARVARAPSPTQ
jgi:hypothetical protein